MKKNRRITAPIATVVCLGLAIIGLATPAIASDQQALVDRARITFDRFMADPNMSWLKDNLRSAKGIVIVPRLLKGGFIWGGSGGSGVLIVPNAGTGAWSEPAFYTLGSVSFGLQIGGKSAEVIMYIRSQRALERMLSSQVRLGADLSTAVGPVGAGAGSNVLADILSFSRSRGAFLGLSLEGSIFAVRDGWNSSYFGKPVRPLDILVLQSVRNPGSADLREAVARAAKVTTAQ